MSSNMFILGEGQVIVNPEKSGNKGIMTVVMGRKYYKLRNVSIECDAAKIAALDKTLWHIIGEGTNSIAIRKESLMLRMSKLSPQNQRDVTNAFEKIFSSTNPHVIQKLTDLIPSQLDPEIARMVSKYYGGKTTFSKEEVVEALRQRAKLTTMMREGKITIVAKELLGAGSYKVVQKAPILWQKLPSISPIHGTLLRAKGRPGVNFYEEMLHEIQISQTLSKNMVPHIMEMQVDERAGVDVQGRQKVYLSMPLCSGGDLDTYCSGNFDPVTHAPATPEILLDHLNIAINVAESLVGMEKAGFVHSDLKFANILMRRIAENRFEAILSDYGLTKPKNTMIDTPAGTFPPPESAEAYRLKRSFALTPKVDSWAFGLLLFSLLHKNTDIFSMTWSSTPKDRTEALTRILGALGTSPADQVINGLLTTEPSTRMSISEALNILKKERDDVAAKLTLAPSAASSSSVSPPKSKRPRIR